MSEGIDVPPPRGVQLERNPVARRHIAGAKFGNSVRARAADLLHRHHRDLFAIKY